MRYLVDPDLAAKAEEFGAPQGPAVDQAPGTTPGLAQPFPIYYPLYGISLPVNDEVGR